jgi:DUF4097 and DUF4098 domain-containing protein YvlB
MTTSQPIPSSSSSGLPSSPGQQRQPALPSEGGQQRWSGKQRQPRLPTTAVAGLAILASLALATTGCRSHAKMRYEEQSQTSMPLAPQTTLLVENSRGSVRLEPGDSGTVRIEANKRAYAFSEREAKKLAAEVSVSVDRVGGRMEVHVEYPPRSVSRHTHVEVFGEDMTRRRAEVDLVVYVPTGTPTRVETRSADLTVDGTSGPLEFGTTSGDVDIEKHAGTISVRSTSGDLSGKQVEGDLDMSTTSGDMEVEHVGGTLRFDSTSGDLEATDVDGSVTVRTVSGDVVTRRAGGAVLVTTTSGDVSVKNVPGDVTIRTASGDVTTAVISAMKHIAIVTTSGGVNLTLPDPLMGKLDVHTSSGEVEAKVRMQLEASPTRRQLVASLGPGDAMTTVQTSSGDISISQGGEKQ